MGQSLVRKRCIVNSKEVYTIFYVFSCDQSIIKVMSMMRFETICLFIAVLLNVWNLAYTGTFSGCFYIDNRTDAVSFYCKESTGTYPKVTCLSLFFGNSSWEANRSAIKSLKLSECKGTDLNRKLYKTFTNLREFDVSFYGVQSLNSEALHLTYLER